MICIEMFRYSTVYGYYRNVALVIIERFGRYALLRNSSGRSTAAHDIAGPDLYSQTSNCHIEWRVRTS